MLILFCLHENRNLLMMGVVLIESNLTRAVTLNSHSLQ
jgi:hypothetical protein